ncbi:hypothetical protein BLA60_28040 [Actinophytocola xinjiangensis]|uniref:Nitroreductase domain-containing protein n=1 Tax=Actinophytocola xinjiangensis TaxID=485602 RepID=A0A7Z0WHK7_9PSEU|nr:nitroreductase family protein [Actinophytocola xinjiangensis]OLF07412.1 hypothetical protein BLA60_28040 [Actinophytocola xinjiangensis]
MTDHVPGRETVRQAIELATRAPSVHNTQPWRWQVDDHATIRLFADRTRQVPVTDPDGRDLVLSCGAALHHLRVALAALGWTGVVRRLPDPTDASLLAVVGARRRVPGRDDLGLADAIRRRQTDRRRYSWWPMPPEYLQVLADAAAGEGGHACVVTDPAARFHLAGAIAQAAVVQESNPDYAVEMAIWSGRRPGSDDGVLAASVPLVNDAATTPRQRAFSHGTLAQPTRKRYGELASMLVVATPGDDRLAHLRAGEATSAVLLHAARLGIATCPMSQPLEIADTRRTVQREVLGGEAVPQLLIRLGWAPPDAAPIPRSPRRDLDDVLSVS